MRRLLSSGFCATGLTILLSAPAEAAAILPCPGGGATCVAIAEFSWVVDGFGDTFELENMSGAIGAADFTAASVLVDGVDDVLFPDDPIAPGVVASVFPSSAALNSVAVSFTYQGALFDGTILTNQLVDDPLEETRFFSTFIYAERAVPEPSTLALLSVGTAVLLGRRRQQRGR